MIIVSEGIAFEKAKSTMRESIQLLDFDSGHRLAIHRGIHP
jgi:hypothetical protein